MYIHIGDNKIISDRKCIGFFNTDTLKMSQENKWYTTFIKSGDKTIAVDEDNRIISSKVSPFTIIQRTSLDSDYIWRKGNDEEL